RGHGSRERTCFFHWFLLFGRRDRGPRRGFIRHVACLRRARHCGVRRRSCCRSGRDQGGRLHRGGRAHATRRHEEGEEHNHKDGSPPDRNSHALYPAFHSIGFRREEGRDCWRDGQRTLQLIGWKVVIFETPVPRSETIKSNNKEKHVEQ